MARQPPRGPTPHPAERAHSYLGYLLRVRGTLAGAEREFVIALGKAAHAKLEFRAGDPVEGEGVPVADTRLETADLYRASGLEVVARGPKVVATPPPCFGVPPSLKVYRARSHRRLAAQTFAMRCSTSIWGCEIAVGMIVDQWNPSWKRYSRETFWYGPKSCRLYAAGPTRKVPGCQGMSWGEADWVDEETTGHQGRDEKPVAGGRSRAAYGSWRIASRTAAAPGARTPRQDARSTSPARHSRPPAQSAGDAYTRSRCDFRAGSIGGPPLT